MFLSSDDIDEQSDSSDQATSADHAMSIAFDETLLRSMTAYLGL
jgi:hypothetical protein